MIDIHIHSNHSDGTYSVSEILQRAEKLNLSYISITDHDTVSAYEELNNIDISKYYSGKIIQGVELKSLYDEKVIDLLGYKIDVQKLKNWLDEFYKTRKRADIQNKYFNQLYDVCKKI